MATGPLSLDDFKFLRLEAMPRSINMERQRSCEERSLHELEHGAPPPRPTIRNLEHLKIAENVETAFTSGKKNTSRLFSILETHHMMTEAWDALRQSLVYFRGQPVGTIAALDPSEDSLNYNQVLFFKVGELLIYAVYICFILQSVCNI